MNLRDKEMRKSGDDDGSCWFYHMRNGWDGKWLFLPLATIMPGLQEGGGAGGISWMSLNGKSMVILPSWPPNTSLLATTLTEVSNFYHLMRESDSK